MAKIHFRRDRIFLWCTYMGVMSKVVVKGSEQNCAFFIFLPVELSVYVEEPCCTATIEIWQCKH